MENKNEVIKVYCDCEERNDLIIKKIKEFMQLMSPMEETHKIEKADVVVTTNLKDLPPEDGKQYLIVDPDPKEINTGKERNDINPFSSEGGYEENLLCFFSQILEIRRKKYKSSL